MYMQISELNTQADILARRNELKMKAVKIRFRNLTLQLLVAVVIFGSWQLLADHKILDPILFLKS